MGRPERPEHPGRPAGGRPEIPEAIPPPRRRSRWARPPWSPAAPAQADQQPQPASQAEPPVNTEEDLDALLREVRDLLAESPVPTLTQEQLEKPAQPVEEVAIQEEPEAEAAPEAPRPGGPPAAGPCRRTPGGAGAAPQEEAPGPTSTWEEPTIHIGEIPTQALWQGDGQDKPAAENYADVIDDQPTQVIPTQEISKEIQAQQAAKAQEDEAAEPQPAQEDLLEAVFAPPGQGPSAEEKAAARRAARKKKEEAGDEPCSAHRVPDHCGGRGVHCGAHRGARLPDRHLQRPAGRRGPHPGPGDPGPGRGRDHHDLGPHLNKEDARPLRHQ